MNTNDPRKSPDQSPRDPSVNDPARTHGNPNDPAQNPRDPSVNKTRSPAGQTTDSKTKTGSSK